MTEADRSLMWRLAGLELDERATPADGIETPMRVYDIALTAGTIRSFAHATTAITRMCGVEESWMEQLTKRRLGDRMNRTAEMSTTRNQPDEDESSYRRRQRRS